MHFISTLALAAAIAAPATTLTAPVAAPQAQQQAATSKAQPNVSTNTKRDDKSTYGIGQQASDDAEGFLRLQEQARQLGAAQ